MTGVQSAFPLLPSQIFSALPVRLFLTERGYETNDPELQISLGLIWGTEETTLDARQKSHLTHSTPMDHQIRFPLRDRVERQIKKLAMDFRSRYLESDLQNICRTIEIHPDDFVSVEFFKHLPQLKIEKYLIQNIDSLLTPAESRVMSELVKPTGNTLLLIEKARERIYTGDYSTAYKILSRVQSELRQDDINYMLGLCTNFFGQTAESEKHFRKLLQSNNPLSFVQGSYVLSMLYLRMHSKEKQDLATAIELLEKAHQALVENPTISDHTFHQVFNRNGFALCLFRLGRVEEALKLLDEGIKRLRENSAGANSLHQSVLIYNSVQCLRILGRYSECESRCQELLSVDPLFPEYSLEFARTFIDQRKFSEALLWISRAESLDPWIAETQALKAYIYVEQEQFDIAAEFYRRALSLNPKQSEWKEDLEYCKEQVSAMEVSV